MHISIEFPDDEETAQLREILSAVSCTTCKSKSKGYCSGLHVKLTNQEIALGKMRCDGTKHEPIFTKYQVEDICNVWTYGVVAKGASEEHETFMLTDSPNDL